MYVYDNRGLFVRLIWLSVAFLWWFAACCGFVRRPRAVTLCYHGVTAGQRARFAKQMARIADRAVDNDGTVNGEPKRWGRPKVSVTFDDGFANLLDHALPVTSELGIPVIVFVVTDNLGGVPKWDIEPDDPDATELTACEAQLQQMASVPLCRLASHSSTHPRLTNLTLSEARRELIDSRFKLQELLGQSVEDFAFPHGACSAELMAEAFSSGYRRVHTISPIEVPTASCGEVISRMKMSPDAWIIEFQLTVAGAYDWLVTLRRVWHRLRQPATALPTAQAVRTGVENA